MKWVIAAAWAALIGLLIILFVPSVRADASKLIAFSQCDYPLEYKLGSVDARFNLERNEALKDIQDAGNIWSNAYGKNLFKYDPEAKLTISFIYDERQALSSKINELDSEVSQKNAELQQQINTYKKDSADFERRLNEFVNTVNKYNSEGGAPEEEYNKLLAEQDNLKAEASRLNERAKQLNLSTTDYNANVSVLNNNIGQFKEELKKKPEEGLYDGAAKTISIYFVDDHNELVHTLAHEFGHALGMDHVNDRLAIMYPNTTTELVPTEADIKELEFVCRNQPAPAHWIRGFREWVYDTSKALSR